MHKVAVDTLNTLAKIESDEVSVEIGKINETSITMNVKNFISMRDFDKFVSEMMHSQFTDDGDFKPQFDNIVFDIALCEYYTNLNLPSEVEKSYELIQRLGLKKKILSVVGRTTQYNDLIRCIKEAHAFVKTEKTGLNGLLSVLKNVISDFDMKEILETLKGFDLEKLEHLPEIKELANVFNIMQVPNENNNVVEFPIDNTEGDEE